MFSQKVKRLGNTSVYVRVCRCNGKTGKMDSAPGDSRLPFQKHTHSDNGRERGFTEGSVWVKGFF